MLILLPLLFATLSAQTAPQAQQRSCLGTSTVGTIRLLVKSPIPGRNPLPLRAVHNLPEKSVLTYEPIQLPDNLKKNSKLALMILPADPDTRAAEGATVLEPRSADAPTEWTMPFRVGTLLLVFAPQGLDEKRVTNLVSRDEALIDDLALYASRTVELENALDSLNALDDEQEIVDDPTKALGASPVEEALLTLTRTLNPSSAFFNPLNGGRTVGPVTRAGLAATMTMDNAGAIFPGGGALSMAKQWLLPDSEFRTVYAEAALPDGMTFCSQKLLTRTRNRLVYLWGYQLLSRSAPKFEQARNLTIPAGARSAVPLKTANPQDWPLLDRVREWTLVDLATNREVSIPGLRTLSAKGWAKIDLRNAQHVVPGNYRLVGHWDWDKVNIAGTWRIAPPGDLRNARPTPDSLHRLTENSGMAPIELAGTDFQFVEKVTLKRAGRLGAIENPLEFRLPQGFRGGPQNRLELEINTSAYRAGDYLLALEQISGKTTEVPLRIAPEPPKFDPQPIRLHEGDPKPQRITLRGSGLSRLEPKGLETAGHEAKIQLLDGTDTERDAVVTLAANIKRGARLTVPGGLQFQVTGPKPKILSVTPTLPDDLPAALRDKEVPSGAVVPFAIQAENVEAPASLIASCSDPVKALGPWRIRLGERRSNGTKFDSAGKQAYFAALDPGEVAQSGCDLQFAIETEAAGASAPVAVGKVVRLPKIQSFTWTDEKSTNGFVALLKGTDLELIEKAGWENQPGAAVTAAPKGAEVQTLRVTLPWPSPSPLAPLYIWLRGEEAAGAGRKVTR
ncbi:hypothetical protein F183_A14380 [Bryobacterales bacterium F-183]|nr:hypothetical protein F183_A14380 [Bryobacterales bacterium F-183]